MVLFEPVTKDLRALLERDSAGMSKEMLDDLLDIGRRWKPDGYDEHMERRRLYYEGRADTYLQTALRNRYEHTADAMSLIQLNLVRLIAEVDASVYDYEPHRYLIDEEGAKVAPDDERARRFDLVVEGARMPSVMVEAERRLMAVDTLPVRIGWEPLRGVPTVSPFWPSTVWVVPHPSRPWDEKYFLALVAEISGPNGLTSSGEDARWYEVWWRADHGFDALGVPRFGPWYRTRISSKGDTYEPWGAVNGVWPLELPWVFLQNGIPEGCPWNWQHKDLLDSVNAINVTWSNIFFVLDMQAHDELVLVSEGTPKENIKGGPNVVHQLRRGEALTNLTRSPNLDGLLTVLKDYTRALAITRRQSEDAYSWESKGNPMTGVSRQIKNEPQEKARREHAKLRVREDEEIVRLLIAHADRFGRGELIAPLRPKMQPREPPDFEPPEMKQRRAIEAMKAGLLSPARAAVDAGHYPDIEAAKNAGLSDEIEKPKPPPPFGGAPPPDDAGGDEADDDDAEA